MMVWIKFFFGTPVRALVTLGALTALAFFVEYNPGILGHAFGSLANELTGLLACVVVLLFIVAGFRMIFRGLWK